jgi:hypothetical protein
MTATVHPANREPYSPTLRLTVETLKEPIIPTPVPEPVEGSSVKPKSSPVPAQGADKLKTTTSTLEQIKGYFTVANAKEPWKGMLISILNVKDSLYKSLGSIIVGIALSSFSKALAATIIGFGIGLLVGRVVVRIAREHYPDKIKGWELKADVYDAKYPFAQPIALVASFLIGVVIPIVGFMCSSALTIYYSGLVKQTKDNKSQQAGPPAAAEAAPVPAATVKPVTGASAGTKIEIAIKS